MKGAQSLFNGPTLQWGGEIAVAGGTVDARFNGTGLYALEVSSGHVYALAWDAMIQDGGPPRWVPLP